VFAAYGVFAAALRRRVLGRPSLVTGIRRVFAGCYVAVAGRLALPENV
jgi:threonine/homoserine/homoserine lactone efflux protein